MNRALTTAAPAPSGRQALKKKAAPTTKTISTAPLTVSFTDKAVSSAPSSSLSPSPSAAVVRAAMTPTSPLPSSFSSLSPIQNKVVVVVTQPPSSPSQQNQQVQPYQKEPLQRSRTKTSTTVCAQTRGTVVSKPVTNPSRLPSRTSTSCSSSPPPIPSTRSTRVLIPPLSTPSSRIQLHQQQQIPPLIRTRQYQSSQQQQRQQQLLLQKQRQRLRTMTWLDHSLTKPTISEEPVLLAVENKRGSRTLSMSPLSPLPKITVKDEKDLEGPIAGHNSSNQHDGRNEDEHSLYQEEDEEYESEQEDEGLRTLILNSAGESPTEVMSWLQEAIQTVNVLESRVQELEQDCSLIPLYEQDRIQMSEVIQGLDEMVVQDRQWIEHTESAVQWAAHVLEETLLGSFPPAHQRNGTVPLSLSAAARMRGSRSEGMLPNLVAARSQLDEVVAEPITTPLESQGALEQKMAKRRGTLQDEETVTAATSSVMSAEATRYRDGIQAALRHLRTIEHSHTLSSCSNSNHGQQRVDESTKRKSLVPDKAMKTWLENASVTSLTSDSAAMQVDDSQLDMTFDNDDDEDEEDECEQEDRRDSINKAARLKASTGTMTEPLSSPSSPQQHSPASNQLVQSSISLQATLSGSSQSIMANADLGDPCLVDERIYLKQHVQGLDRLRLQEIERHRTTESGYGQLVQDLARFSNEMLQAVNTLTVAQAALDGANELSLLTLRMVEKEEEELSGSQSSDMENKKGQSSHLQTSSHCQRKGNMIRSSCRELTESVSLVELEIRKMRRLAADCVGITELAHERLVAGTDGVATNGASPCTDIITASENAPSSHPPPVQPQPRTSLSINVPPVQLPSNQSLFVDGVSLQEFEAHLAAIRSDKKNSSAANSMMTPFMKRVLVEDIQPCLLVNLSDSGHHHRSASRASMNGGRWIGSLLGSHPQSPQGDLLDTSSLNSAALLPKLLKAMEKNACEIQTLNGSAKMSSSAVVSTMSAASASSVNARCCLCRIERPCEFRIRILEDQIAPDAVSTSSSSTSTLQIGSRAFKTTSIISQGNQSTASGNPSHFHPLDRFCRERVVAVCDFYMFMAHLRQGLLNHQPSLELFRRALVLRQRMGQARIGSMDIVASTAVSASAGDVTRQ
ncbi:hypothetical protein EMPS_11172 [Entomortierella parvispora]|uniref:Uncharacterized protein n=1 Tax=Entomortierella parvispora TaxID=205924 RepID=A0A9P3HM11_9FUNG|nr:hypothetical protein EMPS_11172 [Entomortierella parvispora]